MFLEIKLYGDDGAVVSISKIQLSAGMPTTWMDFETPITQDGKTFLEGWEVKTKWHIPSDGGGDEPT